jgi:tetratricopeptide (TPR) repeat protein
VGKVLQIASNEKLIEIQENYINLRYKNKDYAGCIESIEYLLSLLPSDPKAQKKMKRFCYLKWALCLKKSGKLQESLNIADIAIKYCQEDDKNGILQMKALIYKELGDMEKALYYLNKCMKWYVKNGMYYEIAQTLDTKARILSSEKLYYEAIEYYNKAEAEGNFPPEYVDDFNRDRNNVYARLIELYIDARNINDIKARQVYNNITDEEVKKVAKEIIENYKRKEV